MRFRDFDFETAIWDCRSAVMMNQRHPQSDVASIQRFLKHSRTVVIRRLQRVIGTLLRLLSTAPD